MRVQHSDVVIGAGAGVVVAIVKHGTVTPAVLWAAQLGEEKLTQVVTNEYGFYSVWLDEGEYDESIAASPREDRVLSILSYQSLQAAAAVKEGPKGEKGEKGEKGDTGEPGAATGGYQTGDLRLTAIAAVAAGWLACDGSAVSRTGETKALFEAIGTAYGAGNGTTTFNLPDFRGRVPMGSGKGTGGEETEAFPERTLGAKVGRLIHKLTAGQMPKHTHVASTAGHTHAASGGNQFMQNNGPEHFTVVGSGYGIGTAGATASAKETVTNAETGASEAHENVQPSTVVSVWIKK